MAPHAALAEIGLEYELVLVGREEAHSSPDYLALNPLGLVPTYVEGDLVLTESAAILLHLDHRHPEARLAPDVRAEHDRWLVFLTNTLQTTLLRFLYPERYGTAGVRELADAEAQRHFDRIEAHLADREWLAAEHRTAADLFLFMLTRWGRRLEPAAWDRPGLRAHARRSLDLPGVQTMMREQGLEAPAWASA